ncbi:hypothetical protein [Lentzea sp.]|nr:hypothetical protein [Lentzea sp.]HUQ58794.1 hypothetical protein [Lentzea sp.]
MCFMFGASEEQVRRVLAEQAGHDEPAVEKVTAGAAEDWPRRSVPAQTV